LPALAAVLGLAAGDALAPDRLAAGDPLLPPAELVPADPLASAGWFAAAEAGRLLGVAGAAAWAQLASARPKAIRLDRKRLRRLTGVTTGPPGYSGCESAEISGE
jgi:hypothetical protein